MDGGWVKTMNFKRLALCALFICMAAVLSAAESWLPGICPILGVTVGLGNIVTMFLLYIGGKWRSLDALIVVVVRCFLAALFTGQIMNVFFDVAGGICALGAMLLLRKILPSKNRENLLPLVGAGGALAHIAGQMATAVIIFGNFLVFFYTPILLTAGIIWGAFSGGCTLLLLRKLPEKLLNQIRMKDLEKTDL